MSTGPEGSRGISPVIGVVLMLGIVVVLVGISAVLFLGLAGEPDTTPNTSLDLQEVSAPLHLLYHEGGDNLGGNGKTEIRGIADPEVLHDRELTAGQGQEVIPVVPINDEIEVVWYGDDGTSHVLHRFQPNSYLDASADDAVGCDWVEDESSGGTDSVKIDGLLVKCEVETDEIVEVQNGGVVVGDTTSDLKEVDADDAEFYGDIEVERNVNAQDSSITGSVSSNDLVKIDSSSVDGSIDAVDTIEIISGSSVGDDVESDTGLVKVLSSEVSGSITTNGSVKLQDATVTGHVYVDPGDFDCTNSTIDGQDCGEYTPQSP